MRFKHRNIGIRFINDNYVTVEVCAVTGDPISVEWTEPPGAIEELGLLVRNDYAARFALKDLRKQNATA